jgi:phosphoribosylaminoimidazole carboxylase (NCAIR synthetase)
MMAVPANDLGIDFKVFAAIPNDSAAQVSHFVLGDYTNIDSVLEFAKSCDVLTPPRMRLCKTWYHECIAGKTPTLWLKTGDKNFQSG